MISKTHGYYASTRQGYRLKHLLNPKKFFITSENSTLVIQPVGCANPKVPGGASFIKCCLKCVMGKTVTERRA